MYCDELENRALDCDVLIELLRGVKECCSVQDHNRCCDDDVLECYLDQAKWDELRSKMRSTIELKSRLQLRSTMLSGI